MEESEIFRIVLTSFIMPVIVSGILIWFIVVFQKRKNQYEIEKRDQKIREQEFTIEKQLALQSIRSRMSQDLHDEMGSGLTSIKYISNTIQETKDIGKIKDIEDTSNHLINSMRDLLWSLDESKDNLGTLLSKIRSTCNQLCRSVDLEYRIKESLDRSIPISGIKRRNIILILKECLTNVVKHAQASSVEINLSNAAEIVSLEIKDDGKGFETLEVSNQGYGINSIKKRVKELNGILNIESDSDGTSISIQVPI